MICLKWKRCYTGSTKMLILPDEKFCCKPILYINIKEIKNKQYDHLKMSSRCTCANMTMRQKFMLTIQLKHQ